jgi:DNA-binding FadR family transcriptional regulator
MNFDGASNDADHALVKLRELLASSTLAEDGKLPTERGLSKALGIGRRAIRRALDVLEAEGKV